MNILGNCIGILGFSIPIITELLILIDYGIYSIACVALNGFFKVLEMSYEIFGASGKGQFDKIYDIIQRAMLLAGIFALFKLSLTLINYIVNPDNAGKATQMGTTIIRKIIIAVFAVIFLILNIAWYIGMLRPYLLLKNQIADVYHLHIFHLMLLNNLVLDY